MTAIDEAERAAAAVGTIHNPAERTGEERRIVLRPRGMLAEHHQQAAALFHEPLQRPAGGRRRKRGVVQDDHGTLSRLAGVIRAAETISVWNAGVVPIDSAFDR